jgi:hypothetical protein
LLKVRLFGWREPLPASFVLALFGEADSFGEAMSCPDERADVILSTPTHIAMKGLRCCDNPLAFRNAANATLKAKATAF